MANPFVHVELHSNDLKKAKEFYSKLFGWKTEPMGPAVRLDTGGEIGGHITALGQAPHQYTIFYVGADDIEATLARARKLGGKTLVPPIEIPTGTFAWMADLEGNTIGLFMERKTGQ